MPGLKEVRIRIASVKSTQQITNAMKMVAASKLRKAQTAIIKLRPYAAKLTEIMQNLSSSLGDTGDSPYTRERIPENVLLVVITSNRGLCGGFNSNIIKATLNLLSGTYNAQLRKGNVSLITIGRKASEFFRKRGYNVVESHDDLFDHLTFDNVSPLAEQLMKAFADKKYDRIQLIYNQFKNAAVQRLIVEQYLPVLPVTPVAPASVMHTKHADYIFEPDQETIVQLLIPKSLRIQLYKSLLDSFASEQGARMTAMHQATENAKELLRALQISYNKARQQSITKELLEIVAGAEALKG
ncbi:MAG: ATP synthase F1 subunit gamma [Bacteroidetes bacterium]|nr:ATP synthase F1 subunit gamma [Bacteroidota bacterium]